MPQRTLFWPQDSGAIPDDYLRADRDGWYEFHLNLVADSQNGVRYWAVQPGKEQEKIAGLIYPRHVGIGQQGDTPPQFQSTRVVSVIADGYVSFIVRVFVHRAAVVEFYGATIRVAVYGGAVPAQVETLLA